jgi:hypothetical protein
VLDPDLTQAKAVFRIRIRIQIRIGSAFDGLLDPEPDSEEGKSAQKRRKLKSEDQKKYLKISIFYAVIF